MKIVRRLEVVLLALLVACVALASCSASGVGTIPSGTPDLGNGTPAIIPSSSPTARPIATAPISMLGATYAFVRDNQLWLALSGGQPAQATKFQYTNLPDVSWHPPLWSPGETSLAFIMNARPAGQGGGGCPAPDYEANGALYVLNAGTRQATQIIVPTDKGDPLASSPTNGYWQYFFWQDATHLLAWYNGVIGKTSNNAGLYRYDMAAKTLTLILPLRSLGVSTLFEGQSSQPLLLSMRYSSGQLFYQVVDHPFEQSSQFIIYRRSLDQPASASKLVFTAGSEAWCSSSQAGSFQKPGWDISPDGAQLVVQEVAESTSSAGQTASNVQVLSLSDHTVTPLFSAMSATMLASDLTLTWGPDSQTVVASQAHLLSQAGPYSATLANPAAIQAYSPGAAGPAAWRSDSAAFALQNVDVSDVNNGGSLYVYIPGSQQGQLLLNNARDFAWG